MIAGSLELAAYEQANIIAAEQRLRAGGAGVPIHRHKFNTREDREEVLGVFDGWLLRLTEVEE